MLEMSIVYAIKWMFIVFPLWQISHKLMRFSSSPHTHTTSHTKIVDRLIVMQTFFRKIITIKNSKEINANLWYNWKFIGICSPVLLLLRCVFECQLTNQLETFTFWFAQIPSEFPVLWECVCESITIYSSAGIRLEYLISVGKLKRTHGKVRHYDDNLVFSANAYGTRTLPNILLAFAGSLFSSRLKAKWWTNVCDQIRIIIQNYP